MKSATRILFVLSLIPAAGATAFLRPGEDAELDAIAAAAYPADEPGAAVIVVRDGEVVLKKGYGMADLELGVRVEPDMVFRIGSVTKQFTAAAILLLEERGKLSVKDDIRRYLPDYPTEGKTITIEHLLTHTSGIRSYTDMESFAEIAREDLSVEELIASFENEPLAFEPGEKYAYNNSGYFLLGAIIEKVSGSSYESFVQENIFDPVGMSQSYYGDPSRLIARRARGYEERDGEFVNADYLSMKLPYAAGSLLSTVGDLAKWDRALYTTDLLSQSSLDKWWKPFHLTNGANTYYGYGWSVISYEDHPVMGHGGGINGFTCYVLRMPRDRVFVAVLSNRNTRQSSPTVVARRLAAAAIGRPIGKKTPVTVSPEVLERHTGVYRVDENAYHVVKLEEGTLILRRYGDEHPDGGRVRNPGPSESLNRVDVKLLPSAENAFFVEDSLLTVRFEADELVISDWDREERARKTDTGFDDESMVLATVQRLFDAMASRDRDAMASVLDRGARLVQTFTENGVPALRKLSVRDFLERISTDGPSLDERTWDPRVRIEDNLATVWLSYNFYFGGELDHCGEDAFQLARTNLGWKIIAIADTQRREGCVERN